MDYDFNGLSTRSFEQLVQSLAAKIIGPGIVIFGDGPDGGREAVFEGKIPFPSGTSGWNGYGVVQAKFKQRPLGTEKDGAWALKQLRNELEKFAAPENGLKKPLYYIFATNVVLSSVWEKGHKDKAAKLFEEFKEKVPIKDFRIWDYDQIGSFLDNAENIRRAYAAWITPGDVLSQMMETLKPSPDFEHIMTQFLQRELMGDQYSRLEQAGHSAEGRTALAEVFVDLHVTKDASQIQLDDRENDKRHLPAFIHDILEIGNCRLDPRTLEQSKKTSGDTDMQSEIERGRVVLVGGPGQGKSTVSQFLCQLYRAALLRNRPAQMLTPETKDALELLASQSKTENLDYIGAKRFPIMVKLNLFASELASKDPNTATSLLSYMLLHIKKHTDQELCTDHIRSWLANYPWLIVLDGLDEVPSSSNRHEVLQAIDDFLVQATTMNADLLLIATTRPQGYNEEFSPKYYQHMSLAPLSVRRAQHYADRLTHARYGNEKERMERIMTRLNQASSEKTTMRLMRSPLQVTIMTTLVDQIGRPPQERWRLFKEYYKIIYQREMERDIPAASLLRDHMSDIDSIHQRVALALQVVSEQTGRTDALLPCEEFAVLVGNRLKEEGNEGNELEALKNRIHRAAIERLVFLVAPEDENIGFEIRSLQEFMAAECLMDASDRIVAERLKIVAPAAHWRNTFLFAAGKCFAERQYLRDIIHTTCATLNEAPDNPYDSENIYMEIDKSVLSGSRLALDILEDGSVRNQPKYAKLFTRLALKLIDLPGRDSHYRLANQYRKNLETAYFEELYQRLNTVNTEQALGAWTILSRLINDDIHWAKQMGEKFWPTTPAKQIRLLEKLNNVDGGPWLVDKWKAVIPKASPEDMISERHSIPVIFKKKTDCQWLDNFIKLKYKGSYRSQGEPSFFLKIAASADDILSFQQTSIQNTHQMSPVFKNIPFLSEDWAYHVAAETFFRTPSKKTLANALKKMAETPLGFHFPINTSWPLQACLNAAKEDNRSLNELAHQAESGELGNFSDWKSAEQRWQRHGITKADLEYMADDNHWPYDQQIGKIGYPFSSTRSSIFMSKGLSTLTKALHNIYKGIGTGLLKEQIAHWLEVSLEFLGDMGNEIFDIEIQELADIVNTKKLPFFRLNALKAIRNIDVDTPEFANSIHKIGIKKRGIYIWGNISESARLNNIGTKLEYLYQNTPNCEGFLNCLADFCCAGYQPKPFSYPSPEKIENPFNQQQAILLRLSQADLTMDEARTLGKLFFHATNRLYEKDQRSQIQMKKGYRPLLELIKVHQLNGPPMDAFLLTIAKELQVPDWEERGSILGELLNSQHRRVSGLANQEVWEKTDLPKDLWGICKNNSCG